MDLSNEKHEMEAAAFQELESRLKASGNQEAMQRLVIKSFLKDSKGNVDEAEQRILDTMNWRKENNIDTITSENFDDVWQPFAFEWTGYAKDGRPVLIVYSTLDKMPENDSEVKEMIKHGMDNKERNTRFVYYLLEVILAKIKETGTDSIVVIQDMNKLQPARFTSHISTVIPFGLDLANTCLAHYPRIVHQLFAINGSKKLARIVLGILRKSVTKVLKHSKNPNLAGLKDKSKDKKNMKKLKTQIQVLGKKKIKWGPILQNFIDANQLTEKYGGTKPTEQQHQNGAE